MKHKVRRKQKTGISKFFTGIFALLLIVGLIYNLFNALTSKKTYLLDHTIVYEESVPFDGFFVFDENVHMLPEGTINDLAESGERLPIDAEVGTVEIGDVEQELAMQKSFLQEQIQNMDQIVLKAKPSDFSVERIVNNLRNEDYQINENMIYRNIILQKKKPEENTEETEMDTERTSNDELTVEDYGIADAFENLQAKLEDEYAQISSYCPNTSSVVKMNEPGYILPYLDGYEDVFRVDNMLNYQYDDFKQVHSKDTVTRFRTGYKTVNNLQYYLNIGVNNDANFSEENIGENILIKIYDFEIGAIVNDVSVNNQGTRVNLLLEDYYNAIKDQRWVSGEIIRSKQQAFIVPSAALCEKNGQKGVMISNDASVAEFVPVEVLKDDGKEAVLSAGKHGIITTEDEEMITLVLYQRVLLSPNKVTEGELIR